MTWSSQFNLKLVPIPALCQLRFFDTSYYLARIGVEIPVQTSCHAGNQSIDPMPRPQVKLRPDKTQ